MITGIVASRPNISPPLYPNDASYASVISLMHYNGPNAGTRFIDQRRPYIWTRNGTPTIDTSQSKFLGASGSFNGSNQYLSSPANAEFNLNGDLTVECWLRLTSLAAING
ncbi:MAG: hypothetical protein ACREXP_12555, partial [Steroidobacteraceae bacterium]